MIGDNRVQFCQKTWEYKLCLLKGNAYDEIISMEQSPSWEAYS
jgi:hypothetical protein